MPGGQGQWDLEQTRLHNKVNEIDSDDDHLPDPIDENAITETQGPSWIVPGYDAAGNMTSAPRPGQESTVAEALLTVYDAWNRAAKVYKDTNENGSLDAGTDALVAEYRYDGLSRRIAKIVPHGESNWDRTDYYYNEGWQCLEERFAGNQEDEDDVASTVKVQWLWDIRYIDAPGLAHARLRPGGGQLDVLEGRPAELAQGLDHLEGLPAAETLGLGHVLRARRIQHAARLRARVVDAQASLDGERPEFKTHGLGQQRVLGAAGGAHLVHRHAGAERRHAAEEPVALHQERLGARPRGRDGRADAGRPAAAHQHIHFVTGCHRPPPTARGGQTAG